MLPLFSFHLFRPYYILILLFIIFTYVTISAKYVSPEVLMTLHTCFLKLNNHFQL